MKLVLYLWKNDQSNLKIKLSKNKHTNVTCWRPRNYLMLCIIISFYQNLKPIDRRRPGDLREWTGLNSFIKFNGPPGCIDVLKAQSQVVNFTFSQVSYEDHS